MAKRKMAPYTKQLKELMAEKSRILSQAQAFEKMGLTETAQPLWSSAASYEERIAPLMDALGRDAEAALHRVSAASCYEKSGDLTRAANLYRAALGGPLVESAKSDVQQNLCDCLSHVAGKGIKSGQMAPISGLYQEIGLTGKKGREVVVGCGERLPPTRDGSTYNFVAPTKAWSATEVVVQL